MQNILTRNLESALWRKFASLALLFCVALLSCWGIYHFYFVAFLSTLTIGLIAGILIVGNSTRLFFSLPASSHSVSVFQNAALIVAGTMFAAVCTEAFLAWRAQRISSTPERSSVASAEGHGGVDIKASFMGAVLQPQALASMVQRQGLLTLPREWEHQELSPLPGTERTYKWHGVVHVVDQSNFRRVGPFHPRQTDIFRIMVVGDSLTYGHGVDERFIYTSLLQDELGTQHAIEILNLGVPGYQSEDVLAVIRRFLPELTPDLVIYGVCLNDFLPSKTGQYTTRGFEFPISEHMERFLRDRTRLAGFLADLYDRSLRAAGLRADFFDDILKDFAGYQQRFRRDVMEMNSFVTGNGLPPVLAMVLDQFPIHDGTGYKIAKAAEGYLDEAGMDVIKTEEYYQRLNGHMMPVSLWEGHPNEEAHAIFSWMILKNLRDYPALQSYRRMRSG